MARSLPLAKAGVAVVKIFREPSNADIAFMGLAGTEHQKAAEEEGVRFIPGRFLSLMSFSLCTDILGLEWFADLDYSPEGKLLITKRVIHPFLVLSSFLFPNVDFRTHDKVSLETVRQRVNNFVFRLLACHLQLISVGRKTAYEA